MLTLGDVEVALKRVRPFVHLTPIFSSSILNEILGHEIYFKAECLQKVGAFKARGALNMILWMRENNIPLPKIVAYSSGNHAQGVAWASQLFKIPATVYMPKSVSKIKAKATESYGAKVVLCETRQVAERLANEEVAQGAVLIPPYDHDQIICGQGTATLEAIKQIGGELDAVFTPCGGGGLLSGTMLAARGLQPKIKVFGAEPLNANDAARSLRDGKIFRWDKSPDTIADGVQALSVSERTFQYLKLCDGIFEIGETDIIRWTQLVSHLLKLQIEPTAALGVAAAASWLKTQKAKTRVLILLSGGNMDNEKQLLVWKENLIDLQSLNSSYKR